MIFKNDKFLFNGAAYRLLHNDAETDRAWAIDINEDKAWPREFIWSRISKLNPYVRKKGMEAIAVEVDGDEPPEPPVKSEEMPVTKSLVPSSSMKEVKNKALDLLGYLVDTDASYPQIFDANERGPMILQRATEAGCSIPTIYKHLRQFWLGGQTPSALLGNFHRCGRTITGVTGGRGASPEFERSIYQLSERDIANFERAIQEYFLKSGSLFGMTDTHQKLLENYYQVADGNGDESPLPEGERPSFRQFQYYVKKAYPLEARLRSRLGNKDFERDHREVLGTIMDICHGVGHYYEADATIADNYLIAADDIKQIIGKPTIYLVIDRKSRLIVGWYVGMENASWIVAMQAFVSISQDKQAICARLGVPYNPADWPAHQVFPQHVLGDRSEILTKSSCQLSTELGTIVSNLPSKRPDWKPVVECEFKQTRRILQAGAPGFDPPENAKKRQGKHYDKDACMTLLQFEAVILRAIIAHNRKPLLDYPLTLKEIGNEVKPIPIELWNHDIAERAGLLPRFEEDIVRMALLSRDEASVSEEGILYKGLYYACREGSAKGWFVTARNKRFKLKIAFDRRLVNTICAFDPDGSGRYYECNLTTRSNRYVGLSFCEVYAIEKMLRRNKPVLKQIQSKVFSDFHKGVEPGYAAAKKELKDAKLSSSRSARKADIKEARSKALQDERQELATFANKVLPETAQVISLVGARAKVSAAHATSSNEEIRPTPSAPKTALEKINQLKEKMLRGQL